MAKKVIQCVLAVLLFFGISINGFALTSDAPPLILTNQQKEYFSQIKSLRVLTAPDMQPYAYQDTGVSVDILERLCTAAGVELQLVETENYSDALNRLENGEAELSAVKIAAHGKAENILPYLESPLQVVFHKQANLTKQSSLSIVQLQGIDFYYAEKYSFVDALAHTSVRDCLNAVRGRQADLFLCDIYQLSVFSESFAARDLTMANLPRHEVTVGFGLHEKTDKRLVSALQSAVDSFSTSELNSSLIQHEQYHETGFKLTQFVYQNPFELLCAVTSLFFVMLLCIFVFFQIRARQHRELRGYEESYRMLADTFGEAGLEYDFLNDCFTFFGGRRGRIDLPEVVEQVHNELDRGALRLSLTSQELDELLQNNAPDHSYEVELQCGMKEGSWNWFRMIYIVVCTSESHRRPIRLIGCLVNIEDEHREKERLLELGYHDPLTGLLNRAQGENKIMQALDEDDAPKVLLFMDIDYFKSFNDEHGHSCGDAVLSALATAICEIFSQDDILCRWGGDEFLLLVTGKRAQPDNLFANLKKLHNRMQTFIYLGNPLPVTLSVGGAAALPEMSFQSLFELADSTLYAVKDKGRNHFHVVYPKSNAHFPCWEELQ